MQEFLSEHAQLAFVGVIVLGILAQLLANRFRLPSILLLLGIGLFVSPAGANLFDPSWFVDQNVLFGFVSVSVAVILFEGGLTLKRKELEGIFGPLNYLVTVGALVTFALTSVIAWLVLGWDFRLSCLIGAILIVTGPTVIGPLLRTVRPKGRVANIVKWEGILNDPIGVMLAVLAFEIILPIEAHSSAVNIILIGIVKTLGTGTLLGLLGAWILIVVIERHWIPEFLIGVTTLAVVLAVFAASNMVQHEAGLFTVTLMGIVLANQRRISIKQIYEFKEHLTVLLISILFIILSARFTEDKLDAINISSFVFLAALVVIVRPVSVFVSTWGSELTVKEKLFVSWMAPRGIVAAAMASLFSLELAQYGVARAAELEAMIFVVIIGTVVLYGLTATPVARMLGVATPDPQGLFIVGAQSWTRRLALAIEQAGFRVQLIDTNPQHVAEGRAEGLQVMHGNVLTEGILATLDFSDLGRCLAMTANNEANSLVTLHCREEFGRNSVYQIRPEPVEDVSMGTMDTDLQGQPLFLPTVTFSVIQDHVRRGAEFQVTTVTETFTWENLVEDADRVTIPLMVVRGENKLEIVTEETEPATAGQSVIVLATPVSRS